MAPTDQVEIDPSRCSKADKEIQSSAEEVTESDVERRSKKLHDRSQSEDDGEGRSQSESERESKAIKDEKDSKRESEDDDDGEGEEKEVEEGNVYTATKRAKSMLARNALFTKEDDILILKFMANKGYTNMNNDCFDDIKSSFNFPFTKLQLYEKVRRLRRRFHNARIRGSITNSNDVEFHELARKVWGADGLGVPSKAIASDTHYSHKAPKILQVKRFLKPWHSIQMHGGSSLGMELTKEELELIPRPKRFELERKWKKLKVEEIELYLERLDLVSLQTKLVLEVLKSKQG